MNKQISAIQAKIKTGKVKNKFAAKAKIKKLKNIARISNWLAQ
jgi:hypothetical protein